MKFETTVAVCSCKLGGASVLMETEVHALFVLCVHDDEEDDDDDDDDDGCDAA